MMVITPDGGDIIADGREINLRHRIDAQVVPTDFSNRIILWFIRLGGAIEPEAPHKAGIVLPGAPVVATVVAAMEGVVRIEDDAAGAQGRGFKGVDQRPACLRNGFAHADVVGRAGVDDVVQRIF